MDGPPPVVTTSGEAGLAMPNDPTAERARLMAESFRLLGQDSPDPNRVRDVNRRYRTLLPEVVVARCPDSGEPVRWPIDVFGLDGRFWDYVNSIRRPPRALPPGWLAMTGALRPAGEPGSVRSALAAGEGPTSMSQRCPCGRRANRDRSGRR